MFLYILVNSNPEDRIAKYNVGKKNSVLMCLPPIFFLLVLYHELVFITLIKESGRKKWWKKDVIRSWGDVKFLTISSYNLTFYDFVILVRSFCQLSHTSDHFEIVWGKLIFSSDRLL